MRRGARDETGEQTLRLADMCDAFSVAHVGGAGIARAWERLHADEDGIVAGGAWIHSLRRHYCYCCLVVIDVGVRRKMCVKSSNGRIAPSANRAYTTTSQMQEDVQSNARLNHAHATECILCVLLRFAGRK